MLNAHFKSPACTKHHHTQVTIRGIRFTIRLHSKGGPTLSEKTKAHILLHLVETQKLFDA